MKEWWKGKDAAWKSCDLKLKLLLHKEDMKELLKVASFAGLLQWAKQGLLATCSTKRFPLPPGHMVKQYFSASFAHDWVIDSGIRAEPFLGLLCKLPRWTPYFFSPYLPAGCRGCSREVSDPSRWWRQVPWKTILKAVLQLRSSSLDFTWGQK